MRSRSSDCSRSPFSSTFEMSPRASLPKRFFLSAADPVLVCSSPSRRRAKARCWASARGWSQKTSTASSSMPARISASVSGSRTRRRSIGPTSAAKCGWSFSKVSGIAAPSCREWDVRLLDDRVRRGEQARDHDLLAVDHRAHPRGDVVLPVVALVDGVVEALALGLVLEAANPDVHALVLLADEAAEDDNAHLDLEGDDLLLHALDPVLALPGTDVVLAEL